MSKRTTLSCIGLAATLGAGLFAAYQFGVFNSPPVPGMDQKLYEQVVSLHFIGVAALDAEDNQRAADKFVAASQLAAQEPSVWGNLALAQLRLGLVESAAQSLNAGIAIAPTDFHLLTLMAIMESREGALDKALSLLRTVIKSHPSVVKPRFLLIEFLERDDPELHRDEIIGLYRKMLDQQADNSVLLLRLARTYAEAEDGKQLRTMLGKLAEQKSQWPEQARQLLEQAEKTAESGDFPATATNLMFLRNLLVSTSAFRNNLFALKTPDKLVSEPMYHFEVLPMPPVTMAPADRQLTFEKLSLSGDKVDQLLPLTFSGSLTDQPALAVARNAQLALLADPDTPLAELDKAATTLAPHGVLAVDWTRDFRTDLVLAGDGLRVWAQQAESDPARFEDVTDRCGLPQQWTGVQEKYAGAWTMDLEADGDLDLVLGTVAQGVRVARNNSDGTFTPVELFSEVKQLRDFVFTDADDDGDLDAVLLDSAGVLHIYQNQRSGKLAPWVVTSPPGPVAAMVIGDLDQNGVLDVISLGQAGRIEQLSFVPESNQWQLTRIGSIEPSPSFEVGHPRVLVGDVDTNGGLDLVIGASAGTWVILNEPGDDKFVKPKAVLKQGTFFATDLDINAQGQMELMGTDEAGKPARVRAITTAKHGWQVVRLRALQSAGDKRMNAFALGAAIEVRCGLLVQKQMVTGPRVIFGLGGHSQIDVVRIVWPHGAVQGEFKLAVNEDIIAEQRLTTSCPFLFAYDGQQMSFVTDFLWRSPLGLRINAQQTAANLMTEDWVKIRGDQLVARDGIYDLRITADLWETHFFDTTRLQVVDHDADVEVFVDERFAVPPPKLEVIATTPPQPLEQVWDEHGNPVHRQARERDRVYVDSFELGFFQGVAQEHWVEVVLDERVPEDGNLVLIANGFVYPTDSSINLALDQSGHPRPSGLVLEVAEGAGKWRVVRDNLGFPSGKDKTVVIDLKGIFAGMPERRFRLRTNLEVYWDQLRWAIRLDDAAVTITDVALDTAALQYRGFSQMHQQSRKSPDLPDYGSAVTTRQRWRDLIGYHTRHGDVRDLLRQVDDRYVIMNAGDELRLQFPATPIPKGKVRDFVMVGDGWVKDGNLNTGFSKSVLPLPSHGQSTYDTPPGLLADDPIYQQHAADWQRFHTRFVALDDFRRGLRPTLPGAERRPRP